MKTFISKKVVAAIVGLIFSAASTAEVSIIVNPGNANQLSTEDIKRIFLGKDVLFPDGTKAAPVTVESGGSTDEFNQKVLDRNASQLKAYWSKLVFTGKGVPPEALASDADVVKAVASAGNKIGFVDSGSVDGSVKVLATF